MTIKAIPYQHRNATRVALIASAGLGPMGALSAGGDILAVGGIWSACLVSIAAKEGCNMDKDTAIGICKSAALGVSGYYAGCKLATNLFLLIPGAGILAAMGASSVANIIFTYRFVLTLCRVFDKISVNKSLTIDKIADEVKAMFNGNGFVSDVKDIVSIYFGK